MKTRTLLLASVAAFSVACGPQKPAESIQQDWTSPLDSDLAQAAPRLEESLKAKGMEVHVLWAGARAPEYSIERGPLGDPVRKTVMAMYVFELPSTGKCYMQGDGVLADHVFLARENTGGGQYGPPRIEGYDPLGTSGRAMGGEILCSAAPKAKGGAHAPFGPHAPANDAASGAPAPAADAPTTAAQPAASTPDDALAKLNPQLPDSCQQYARLRCTQPLPAAAKRMPFCEGVIRSVNGMATKPNADASCSTMLATAKQQKAPPTSQ